MLWEGGNGHGGARDVEVEVDEDLSSADARVRPGEGGRLMRELLPWRALEVVSQQGCGKDAGGTAGGVGGKAEVEAGACVSGGGKDQRKDGGKSKSRWGLRVPGMFRRGSQGGGLQPPPCGTDVCKNHGEDEDDCEDDLDPNFDAGGLDASLGHVTKVRHPGVAGAQVCIFPDASWKHFNTVSLQI